MHRLLLLLCCLIPLASQAAETEFRILLADQASFRGVAEDMTAAFSYKPLQPAEPLGITGFDVGVAASYTGVENKAAWKQLTGEDVDFLGMAGLTANKGLPFGINVGASFSAVPGTDVTFLGGTVSYALAEGSIISPALALRGTYTQLNGVDDFDFSTWSVDASLSKGFAIVTPYAGVGYVSATADPNSQFTTLKQETIGESRFFGGLKLGFLLFDVTAEVDRTGPNTSGNLKLALGW